jgi:hypothetical protein
MCWLKRGAGRHDSHTTIDQCSVQVISQSNWRADEAQAELAYPIGRMIAAPRQSTAIQNPPDGTIALTVQGIGWSLAARAVLGVELGDELDAAGGLTRKISIGVASQ